MIALNTYKHLPPEQIRCMRSIAGSFSCYSRALDYAMRTTLNDIGATQAKPTESTLEEREQLKDYAAACPQVTMRHHASNMVLNADSDAE